MRWASSISVEARLDAAMAECSDALDADLDGTQADLIAAFVSPHFSDSWARLPSMLARRFPRAVLLGCSGDGVLAAGREIEGERALAMVGASLPGVRLTPLVVRPGDFIDLESACPRIFELAAHSASPTARPAPHFVLLPDPFSCPAETLISELDRLFPASVKVGGLASGARQPGGNLLWAGGEPVHGGAVALALEGELAVDTIVAQGCRPIGLPLFVTVGHGQSVQELDGRRPLDLLRELYEAAPPRDRELFRGSLFVGVVMREGESEYGPGDFLVRNLIQIDAESGALTVAADVREGSVLQFHLRDAETSTEDLDHHLRDQPTSGAPAGALLFSCLGRGRELYGSPDHDSQRFAARYGKVPMAGFFCNGEIGPVHGRTFLHGYTSSFGLFRTPRRSP